MVRSHFEAPSRDGWVESRQKMSKFYWARYCVPEESVETLVFPARLEAETVFPDDPALMYSVFAEAVEPAAD